MGGEILFYLYSLLLNTHVADTEGYAVVGDDVAADALRLLAAVKRKLRREERAARLDDHGTVSLVEPLRLHAEALLGLAALQPLQPATSNQSPMNRACVSHC